MFSSHDSLPGELVPKFSSSASTSDDGEVPPPVPADGASNGKQSLYFSIQLARFDAKLLRQLRFPALNVAPSKLKMKVLPFYGRVNLTNEKILC